MTENFRVRAGTEDVAALFEAISKLRKVIDFAVGNDPDRIIFIGDGLMSARQINNAEPAHPEGDTTAEVVPMIIRAAVRDGLSHSGKELPRGLSVRFQVRDAVDSTHLVIFPPIPSPAMPPCRFRVGKNTWPLLAPELCDCIARPSDRRADRARRFTVTPNKRAGHDRSHLRRPNPRVLRRRFPAEARRYPRSAKSAPEWVFRRGGIHKLWRESDGRSSPPGTARDRPHGRNRSKLRGTEVPGGEKRYLRFPVPASGLRTLHRIRRRGVLCAGWPRISAIPSLAASELGRMAWGLFPPDTTGPCERGGLRFQCSQTERLCAICPGSQLHHSHWESACTFRRSTRDIVANTSEWWNVP